MAQAHTLATLSFCTARHPGTARFTPRSHTNCTTVPHLASEVFPCVSGPSSTRSCESTQHVLGNRRHNLPLQEGSPAAGPPPQNQIVHTHAHDVHIRAAHQNIEIHTHEKENVTPPTQPTAVVRACSLSPMVNRSMRLPRSWFPRSSAAEESGCGIPARSHHVRDGPDTKLAAAPHAYSLPCPYLQKSPLREVGEACRQHTLTREPTAAPISPFAQTAALPAGATVARSSETRVVPQRDVPQDVPQDVPPDADKKKTPSGVKNSRRVLHA